MTWIYVYRTILHYLFFVSQLTHMCLSEKGFVTVPTEILPFHMIIISDCLSHCLYYCFEFSLKFYSSSSFYLVYNALPSTHMTNDYPLRLNLYYKRNHIGTSIDTCMGTHKCKQIQAYEFINIAV